MDNHPQPLLCRKCRTLVDDMVDFKYVNKPAWKPGEITRRKYGLSNHWTFEIGTLEEVWASANQGCQLCSFVRQKYGENISKDLPSSTTLLVTIPSPTPVFDVHIPSQGLVACFELYSRDGYEWDKRHPRLTAPNGMKPPPPLPTRDAETDAYKKWRTEGVAPKNLSHMEPRHQNFRLKRIIDRRSDSDACFQLAASWLDDCIRNHDRCIRPSNPRLPTRVIDVGPSDGSVQPRLFETSSQRGKYLALSHCWGSSWRLVTTQQNIEELKTNIEMLAMAKVFQDAVVITRRLGFQYLWIDSFCIIQDSDEDWTREAAKMADVYSNCYLTISARDSPDSNQGIFKDRPPVIWPIEIYSPFIGTPENSNVEFGIREDTDRFLGTPDSALARRSWALQEYFLSTAILHYCNDQLRWECESRVKMEDQDSDMDLCQRPFIKGLLPAGDVMKVGSPDGKPKVDGHFVAWYKIVQDYSGKALSVKTDRLPAISALVKTFSRLSGAHSVAGLWLEDLDRGLLWHRWEQASTHPNVQTRRSPSWCWTSIDSLVFYHHLFGSSFEDYVHYIWATRIPSPSDCLIVDAFMSKQKDHTRSGIYKGCIQLWALSRCVEVRQVRGAYAGQGFLYTSVGEPLPCIMDTEIPPTGKLRCIRLSNWRQEQQPFVKRTIPGPLLVRGYYMVVERAEPTDIRRHPADMGSFRRVGIGSDLVENVDAFFWSSQKQFFKIC